MAATSAAVKSNNASTSVGAATEPANARMVLAALIIIAAVANLPLAMANVVLPSIGAVCFFIGAYLMWPEMSSEAAAEN